MFFNKFDLTIECNQCIFDIRFTREARRLVVVSISKYSNVMTEFGLHEWGGVGFYLTNQPRPSTEGIPNLTFENSECQEFANLVEVWSVSHGMGRTFFI